MHWEPVSVIICLLTLWISIMALGLPILSKLSACVSQLADLRVQWTHCREADHAAHEVFAEQIEEHAEQLEEHAERIGVLEGTEEDWIGDRDDQKDEGPRAA